MTYYLVTSRCVLNLFVKSCLKRNYAKVQTTSIQPTNYLIKQSSTYKILVFRLSGLLANLLFNRFFILFVNHTSIKT